MGRSDTVKYRHLCRRSSWGVKPSTNHDRSAGTIFGRTGSSPLFLLYTVPFASPFLFLISPIPLEVCTLFPFPSFLFPSLLALPLLASLSLPPCPLLHPLPSPLHPPLSYRSRFLKSKYGLGSAVNCRSGVWGGPRTEIKFGASSFKICNLVAAVLSVYDVQLKNIGTAICIGQLL